eukprot:179523-Rhodomonas_salina.4
MSGTDLSAMLLPGSLMDFRQRIIAPEAILCAQYEMPDIDVAYGATSFPSVKPEDVRRAAMNMDRCCHPLQSWAISGTGIGTGYRPMRPLVDVRYSS